MYISMLYYVTKVLITKKCTQSLLSNVLTTMGSLFGKGSSTQHVHVHTPLAKISYILVKHEAYKNRHRISKNDKDTTMRPNLLVKGRQNFLHMYSSQGSIDIGCRSKMRRNCRKVS